jgi:hypothetical protein
MSSKNLYIVAVIFILASLLLGDKIRNFFANAYPAATFQIGYTFIIVLLFSSIYFIFFKSTKEDFFFQVSKCNPKCSGAYYGKPATFQFTPLSPNGTTCTDKNCGYGMISECKNPECKEKLQKYGRPSPNEQL